jgi:hypothetical protein
MGLDKERVEDGKGERTGTLTSVGEWRARRERGRGRDIYPRELGGKGAVTLAIGGRTTGARERAPGGRRLHKRSLAPGRSSIWAYLWSLAERGLLHPRSLAEGVDQETKHAEPASDGAG